MKLAIRAFFGIALGAVLLWLALSQVDIAEARSAFAQASTGPMYSAVAAYWIAIGLRIARWRLILSEGNVLRFGQVSRALIVGYAVNNVLPARLGELFRADFLRRHAGIARSTALGSIIIERLLDGALAVAFLSFGLAMAELNPGQSVLIATATFGTAAIGASIVLVCFVVYWHDRLPIDRLPWLQKRLGILAGAMAVIHRPIIVKALALSILVWTVEAVSLRFIVSSFGPNVSLAGTCLIIGAAALSTLLPSAPGYIGSLQVAFALACSALGIAPIIGVLSATATQVLLFGSITVVGLFVLALSQFSRGKSPIQAPHP